MGREKKKAYGSSNSGGGKQEEEEGAATSRSSSSVVLEFSQVPSRVFSFGFFFFFLAFFLSFLVIPTYSDLLYCCDWKKSVGSFVVRLGLYTYTLILFFMFAKRDRGCSRKGRKGRRQLCEFFLGNK